MRGLKGLIVGIANEHSIAWGCAKALAESGAELAITYQNEKTKTYVEPLLNDICCPIFLPLDVRDDNQLAALHERIKKEWGQLDFVIHAIAFAPKDDLQGPLLNCSREGFNIAMDISCHSLIRLANRFAPLMHEGGCFLTMSYYGSEKVVKNYNVMGPVKAALEACVRYLAVDLGDKNIRVNAISPGPVKTRAASGLADFDALMEKAVQRAPLHQLVTIESIGDVACFFVSPKANYITGQVIYIDAGYNISH